MRNRQGLAYKGSAIIVVVYESFTYSEGMRLTDTLEKAFNDQITMELTASHVYRQLAIELDLLDLSGMAEWMRAQAEEEIDHANQFINHLDARDNRPQIGAVEAPEVKVTSAIDAFRIALEHEEKVSASIRNLRNLADSEGDIDSRPLLDSFVVEQIEEEDTVRGIIGRLEILGDDGAGLLRLDKELGARDAA